MRNASTSFVKKDCFILKALQLLKMPSNPGLNRSPITLGDKTIIFTFRPPQAICLPAEGMKSQLPTVDSRIIYQTDW